jgi:hypothetical protein
MYKADKAASSQRHFVIYFHHEGFHGIWPEHLIRPKDKFSFEAKYQNKWFECRIEKEGNV